MNNEQQKNNWIADALKNYYSTGELEIIHRNTSLLRPEARDQIMMALLGTRAFPMSTIMIDSKFLRYIMNCTVYDIVEFNQRKDTI